MNRWKNTGFIFGLTLLAILGNHFHLTAFFGLDLVFSPIPVWLAPAEQFADAQGLLAAADMALYDAKHNGRNQVRLATASQETMR